MRYRGALALTLALISLPAFGQSREDIRDVAVIASGDARGVAPATVRVAPVTDLSENLVLLHDNGPIVTHPGGGAGGADASRLQSTSLGMTTLGYSASAAGAFRLTDDFTVPAGQSWSVTTMTFYGYQTGSTTTSTFNVARVQIWNGPPNAGGTVIYGDTTTNRFASSTFSNIFRDTETTVANSTRPIMATVATINTTLGAGTYWVDFQLGGTLASGPFVPAITILGQANTGNGLQWNGTAWVALLDPATTGSPQGLKFLVEGSSTSSVSFVRGDFNGDTKTDILWRHEASGENVAWFMNGATLTTGTFLTPAALPDNNWKMVGTHDFNADNKTDILWRHEVAGENVVWYMNGTVLTSGTFLTPAALVDTNWKMAGTGDFNTDGKPDIAWHHQTSGEIVVWFMNGSVLTSGTFTTPPSLPDTNWRLVGVADFSSDGRPDFLWRHQASGDNVVWFMNGTQLTSGTFTIPAALADTNWQIVATGDYTVPADNKTDIVWRNVATGANMIWFMNGITQIAETATTPAVLVDANWRIVGPR